MKIGFQGVRGSFSDAAIRMYYGSEEHKDELKDSGYETVGYDDFIKMLPSFIIALSSASVGAVFMPAIDVLIGPLGVDGDFAPLAYNLGSILFRPGYGIVFTACSLFTAEMYGVPVTMSWVTAAFLLSFILSVATPPVIGGTTVCFSILFSQLGLNSEALAMIISINAFFEFLTVAVNNYSLESQIILLGNSIGELDVERLRSKERS